MEFFYTMHLLLPGCVMIYVIHEKDRACQNWSSEISVIAGYITQGNIFNSDLSTLRRI